jgi:hypothetical protein
MIKTESRRHHPEFNLPFAREVYSASKNPRKLDGELITSPYDLYSVEELRDRFSLRTGTPVPTDVFVFCKGEPKTVDITKVGGIPYWIDDRKWPTDKRGKPLRFLAQFNFLDSMDLVGALPDSVLSLFVSPGKDWICKPDPIHFEWLPAGRPNVAVTDSKRILFPKSIFHGAIFRTADYPAAIGMNVQDKISQPYNLPILNGTKIGGRPHCIQSGHDLDAYPEYVRENPFRPGKMITIPARPSRHGFLCQLGSIQAAARVAYPWANRPKSIRRLFTAGGIFNEENEICFMDMGSIYVYRSDDGALWSEVESY